MSEPITDDDRERLRAQVYDHVHTGRDGNAYMERARDLANKFAATGAQDEPFSEDASRRHFTEWMERDTAEMMPFAIELWEEGGRVLPLTEEQLANASIRASQAKAQRLTQTMRERISSARPERQALLRAVTGAFQKSNDRMAAYRSVSDFQEGDLQRLAEQTAGDLNDVTVRMKRGEFKQEQ